MTLLSRVIATSIALSASAALVACSSDKEADPAPATTPPPMETVTETLATTVVEQDDDDRDDKIDDQQAESADSLTGDDALTAAYAHAGVDASTVTDKEVELDDGDNGKGPHWEIEFTSNGQEYEYDVDAATGAVLEHEVD
ncbi:PepSY domain-containing protein [Corynebacterium minutissimum]|uniref:PepSY domain-containing protein n=1 Tax=Corynebacterium minutissimum TaxID=38301 RepID=UPI001EF21007|nr:PepSY domain-containing protein [Corynebacterium minutissimum]MCG7229362.1 PepSY domain-containing protein [Corynebacterium minutissimum]MCG7238352.1 PepSY domain-containing protein [Corynebacterium minutissimum]